MALLVDDRFRYVVLVDDRFRYVVLVDDRFRYVVLVDDRFRYVVLVGEWYLANWVPTQQFCEFDSEWLPDT